MADTDTPETSYGQTQDSGLGQLTTASGDIRDLYAYYRLSDHELTSITLKNKVLKREEVWFEGHMNWTFKTCSFKEKFHFGVEGARLEEETRETPENPEAFPPYGYNGLHFSLCSFKEVIEIRDHCTIIFNQCTFDQDVEEVIIGDNCRVEFIGCIFDCALTFDTYCDITFRRCNFRETASHFVKCTDHCKVSVDDCSLDGEPQGAFFFEMDNDCRLTIHKGTLSSGQANSIVAKNNSHVRAYEMTAIMASTADAIVLESGSKLEATNVDTISVAQGIAVNVDASEFFARGVNLINSAQGNAMKLRGALVRCDSVVNTTSGMGTCIDSETSKMFVVGSATVSSGQGTCLLGSNSYFEFNDVATVSSGQGIVMDLAGPTRSYFRGIGSVTTGSGTALNITKEHEVYFSDTSSIVSGSGVAVDMVTGRFENLGGTDIMGTLGGIVAIDAHIRVRISGSILGGDAGSGVDITDSVYDIRGASAITGNFGGFWTANCKGILNDITTIDGGQDVGAVISGCSGPTEWDGITTITSSQGKALVADGDLAQLRVINVDSITSDQATAVEWTQGSGSTVLGYIQSISSESAKALDIAVSEGTCVAPEIAAITAQTATAVTATVAGGLKARDWGVVTSMQGGALDLAVSGFGAASFVTVAEISSQQGDALVIDASGDAKARFKAVATLSSEQGDALKITATGDADVALWDFPSAIESQQGAAADVTASGNSVVTCRSIAGFTSSEGKPLSATVSGSSKFEAVDISETCDTQSATAWTLDFSGESTGRLLRTAGATSQDGDACDITVAGASKLTIDTADELTSQTGAGCTATVSGSSELILRDIDEISSQEGTGFDVTVSDGSHALFNHVAKITSEEGNALDLTVDADATLEVLNADELSSTQGIAVNGTVDGHVQIRRIGKITTEQGQAILISGAGDANSWVEIQGIGEVTGQTCSADMFRVDTIARIRVEGIPTVSVDTSSRYVLYLTSPTEGVGTCEVIDLVSLTASECRGGVFVRGFAKCEMYCASAKGTMAFDTGTSSCVYSSRSHLALSGYTSIENSDGTMVGVNGYLAPFIRVSDIGTIKGKEALHLWGYGRHEIVNVESLLAPDSGSPAVDIRGGAELILQGSHEGSTIEAKDKDTPALSIAVESHPMVRIHKFTVTAAKGKIILEKASLLVTDCTFAGSTSFTDCTGEVSHTDMTCGVAISNSELNIHGGKIDLGANDGPEKDLTVNGSALTFRGIDIAGDETVEFTDSVCDFVMADIAPMSGATGWTISGCVFRGTMSDWDADLNASSESVLDLTKVELEGTKKVNLAAGIDQVLMAKMLTCGEVTSGEDSAVVLVKGDVKDCTFGNRNGVLGMLMDVTGSVTTGLDSGILFNYLTASGACTLDGDSGVLLNHVDITGVLGGNAGLGLLGNHLVLGASATFAATCGVVLNSATAVGAVVIGSDSGAIFSRVTGDVGADVGSESGFVSSFTAFTEEINFAIGTGGIMASEGSGISAISGDCGLVMAASKEDVTLGGDNIGFVAAHIEGMAMGNPATSVTSGAIIAQGDIAHQLPHSVLVKVREVRDLGNCINVGGRYIGGSGDNVIVVGGIEMEGTWDNVLQMECGGLAQEITKSALTLGKAAKRITGTASRIAIGSSYTDSLWGFGSPGTLTVGGTFNGASYGGGAFVTVGTVGTTASATGDYPGKLHVGGSWNSLTAPTEGGLVSVGTFASTTGVGADCGALVVKNHGTMGCAESGAVVDVGQVTGKSVTVSGMGVVLGETFNGNISSGEGVGISICEESTARARNSAGLTGLALGSDYAYLHNAGTGIELGTSVAVNEMHIGAKDLILDTTSDSGTLGGDITMLADYDIQAAAARDIAMVADRNYLSKGTTGTHASIGDSAPTHTP